MQKAATMPITEVAYCTREDVQRALNLADSPRLNSRVDAAVMAGARQAEGFLHRRFYPETKTVAFDMPEDVNLFLDEFELADTPTEVLSAGTAMTVGTDVLLRPRTGPPYRWLEARYAGSVWWQSDATTQDAIEITGEYNYPTTLLDVTDLSGSISSSAGSLTLLDSADSGVGSLLLIGTERMLVTERTLSSTTATITSNLTVSKSETSVPVSDGTLVQAGETITIGTERMYVEDITGDTLIVERGFSGSVLAAHASADVVYAPRTASVLRGLLGTTAAAHSDGAAISVIKAPSLVTELNIAYAINNKEQALGAYARTTGSGENRQDPVGRGLTALEEDAYTRYGVKARVRTV